MSVQLLAADVLTALRLALAIAVSVVLWLGDLTAAAVVVSAGWVTDVADGRLARRSGQPGRLGRWDLAADTAVGEGVLVGLAGAGTIPAGYAVGVLLVFGIWLLGARNFTIDDVRVVVVATR